MAKCYWVYQYRSYDSRSIDQMLAPKLFIEHVVSMGVLCSFNVLVYWEQLLMAFILTHKVFGCKFCIKLFLINPCFLWHMTYVYICMWQLLHVNWIWSFEILYLYRKHVGAVPKTLTYIELTKRDIDVSLKHDGNVILSVMS